MVVPLRSIMPLSPDDLAAVSLRLTAEGVLIPIQAQPGARRNGIAGVHNGRLKVAVTQAAEKGKANKALAEVLAAALGAPRSAVSLARGETSPLKEFCVRGLTPDDVRSRLLPRNSAEKV